MTDLKAQVVLTGDASKLDPTLDQSGKKLDTLQGAGDKAADGLHKAESASQELGKSLGETVKTAAEFAGLAIGAEAAKRLLEEADAWNEVRARIKLAADEGTNYKDVEQQIFEIAQKTEQPLSAVGDLYVRIAQSTKELGLSQKQTLDLTDALTAAIRADGKSAGETQGQIAALARGLADGSIQGKGFTGAIERIPTLANAIATQLGLTRGELARLAEAGQLSSKTLVDAILAQKDALDASAEQLPRSIDEATTLLHNAITRYVADLNQGAGASKQVVEAISFLAHNIDLLSNAAVIAADVGLKKLTIATIEKIQKSIEAAAAAREEKQAAIELADAQLAAAQATERETAAKVAGTQAAQQKAARDAVAAQSAVAAAEAALNAARAEQEAAQQSAALASQNLRVTETVRAAKVEAYAAAAAAAANLERAERSLAQAQVAEAAAVQGVIVANAEAAAAMRANAAASDAATAAAARSAAVTREAGVVTELFGRGLSGMVGALFQLKIAYDIGTAAGEYLYKNFGAVRTAGSFLAEGLHELAATALFTFKVMSNPLDAKAAFQQYLADLKEIHDGYAQGREDAAKYGDAASEAGDKSKAGTDKAISGIDLLLGKYKLLDDNTQTFGRNADQVAEKLKSLTETQLAKFGDEAARKLAEAKQRVIDFDRAFDSALDTSPEYFKDFEQRSRAAFAQAQADVKEFGQVLEQVRTAQLAKLGVDADLIRTGITKATRDATQAIKDLGSESSSTGAEITAAFNAALSKASTKEDARAIGEAVKGIEKPGFDAAHALEQVKQRIDELPAAAQKANTEITNAFAALGLKTKAELDAIAARSTNAYNAVKDSLVSGSNLETQAFAAMAQARLQAAAADDQYAIKREAASLRGQATTGAEIKKINELEAALLKAAGAAEQAGGKIGASVAAGADRAAESLTKAEHAAQEFAVGADAAGARLSAVWNEALAATGQLGAATQQLFLDILKSRTQLQGTLEGSVSGADTATAKIAALDAEVKRLSADLIYAGNIEAFERNIVIAADLAQKAFYEERQRAEELTKSLQGVNGATQNNIAAAAQAYSSFKLLGEQDLSGLRSALDAAKQKLESLRDSAASALTSVLDELDQLAGRQSAIQARQDRAKRDALEAGLAEARAAGDKEAIASYEAALKAIDAIIDAHKKQAKSVNELKQYEDAFGKTLDDNADRRRRFYSASSDGSKAIGEEAEQHTKATNAVLAHAAALRDLKVALDAVTAAAKANATAVH